MKLNNQRVKTKKVQNKSPQTKKIEENDIKWNEFVESLNDQTHNQAKTKNQ